MAPPPGKKFVLVGIVVNSMDEMRKSLQEARAPAPGNLEF
jgi:hypothetical protein